MDYGFEYIQLVKKSDGNEVYSSPAYRVDGSDTYDYGKIRARLQFYFDRVNSGIRGQLESPKLNAEQKKNLKFLEYDDYLVRSAICTAPGISFTPINWTMEVVELMSKDVV